jgi:hypothetical protein
LDASGAQVPDPSTVTPVKITIQAVDVFETVKQLDEYVFDQVEENDAKSQWCSVYMDQVYTGVDPITNQRTKYSSVLLLNSTARSVVGTFGPQMFTAYLKDYLIRNSLVPNDAALNVTFVDHGLPVSKQFESI